MTQEQNKQMTEDLFNGEAIRLNMADAAEFAHYLADRGYYVTNAYSCKKDERDENIAVFKYAKDRCRNYVNPFGRRASRSTYITSGVSAFYGV